MTNTFASNVNVPFLSSTATTCIYRAVDITNNFDAVCTDYDQVDVIITISTEEALGQEYLTIVATYILRYTGSGTDIPDDSGSFEFFFLEIEAPLDCTTLSGEILDYPTCGNCDQVALLGIDESQGIVGAGT